MANMGSRLIGNIIVTLHGASSPTKAEWGAHLELLSRAARENNNSLASCKSLVFTSGGMPDSTQRKESTALIERVDGKEMAIAVVTSSAVVRGVVTAGNWFGLKIQAFIPQDIEQAMNYLGISSPRKVRVFQELDALLPTVPCQAYADIKKGP